MRKFVNRWAGLASLSLIGLLIQDYFHGLEIEGRWLIVVIVLLCLALALTSVTWEPVSDRIAARVPYVVVRRDAAMAAAQSNAQLADEALRQVKRLAGLLGQHTRYAPPSRVEERKPGEDTHARWARETNRRQEHDRSTVARFFEENYTDVMSVAIQLHARGALTDDEIRNLNWQISTPSYGGADSLTGIAPILALGASRLRDK